MGDANLAAESCRADDVVVVEAAEAEVVAAGEINKGGGGGELGGDGGVSNSGEDEKGRSEEGDRNYAGNRWPRQETLALLRIRSHMDAIFRDSTLKGPLWEDVSRKMAALGYNRSAKKCKEKFENVYKYHKRTKDGRTGKSEGKNYRFCDQLEAFETHHHSNNPPLSNKPPHHPPPLQVISTSTTPWTTNQAPTISHIFPAPPPPQNTTNPTINIPPLPPTPTNPTSSLPSHTKSANPTLNTIPHASSNLFSSSTSSSTASDEEFQHRHRKKRKWKEFFRRLTKEVLRKQEELQKKFLETVEKCEHDRMVREEAWRLQEMSRINREHEILVQERSTAAAKDAAVIAFLQKVSGGGGGQQNTNGEVRFNIMSLPPPQPPPPPPPPPSALPKPQQQVSAVSTNLEISKLDYNQTNNNTAASSRWPKTEVQALIQLRTSLDLKYQDNGPKGPLWEEISAGMRRIGYNRSAKRCKEKWENINKYFKKVKDNNKKRSEDSKTCPYFHQLNALYREKNKMDINSNCNSNISCNNVVVVAADQNGDSKVEKPVEVANIGMEPLMVQPERQWPLQEDQNQLDSVMEDIEVRGNVDPNHEEEEEDDGDDDNGDDDGDDDDGDSTEDDEERGGYEIVTNKQSSMDMVE